MLLHDHVDDREHLMKARRVRGFVCHVDAILGKGDRIRNL